MVYNAVTSHADKRMTYENPTQKISELFMSSTYLAISAWREILARIFTGFDEQDNVSPAWLVNPATNRRLKLDRYGGGYGAGPRAQALR